jgi:hypothetical protein
MGLIPSEPIENVVKISEILAQTSVEDAETHPKKDAKRCKRKTERAKGSWRKDKKKKKSQAEGKNMGRKNGVLAGGLCFFLPCVALPLAWQLQPQPIAAFASLVSHTTGPASSCIYAQPGSSAFGGR